MKRIALATWMILAAHPTFAVDTAAGHLNLKDYQALPVEGREAFLAGVADGYVSAVAETGNERSKAIASCLDSFDKTALCIALEESPDVPMIKWSEQASAAQWAINGMI